MEAWDQICPFVKAKKKELVDWHFSHKSFLSPLLRVIRDKQVNFPQYFFLGRLPVKFNAKIEVLPISINEGNFNNSMYLLLTKCAASYKILQSYYMFKQSKCLEEQVNLHLFPWKLLLAVENLAYIQLH